MAGKRIYETDEVKTFAAGMSTASKRKYEIAMKLKITPEMEASMRATESRLDAAMDDPSFRTEHNEILSRYFVQELVENLMTKASFARKAASYPTQRQVLVSVSFGAGSRPTFTVPTKRELAYV